MADLCLLNEDGAIAQRWEIGTRPMSVGRGETADVQVAEKTLSRRHFLIWREGEDFLLKDLGSQNGTWVDGRRAQDTRLQDNVCIVAGRTVFMFSEGGFRGAASRTSSGSIPCHPPRTAAHAVPEQVEQKEAVVAQVARGQSAGL